MNHSPRIAFVAPMKSWGGIELVIVTLCQEFVRRGLQVELVLLRDSTTPYPDQLPEGVRITRLGNKSKLDGIPKLMAWLKRSRPDAIITAKVHAAQAMLMARRLAGSRVPVYVKVTNTLSQIARSRAKRWLVRRLYPQADGIVAVSAGVSEDLQVNFGLPESLIRVIYNPVISRDFAERMSRAIEHPWLPPTDTPVILAVGRLAFQKDLPTLFKAFAQLTAKLPSRLLILGEGPERAELEALAVELGLAERIDLPGQVPDPAPYMRQASLFVLSSRYEGFGNVVAEALATGTPIVSTDCPSGPAEILEHGRHGRLVPVGDAAGLARAMQETLRSSRRQEPPTEAIRRFQAEYVAERYLDLLQP